FKLFRANFRALVLIAAAFEIPISMIGAFLQRHAYEGRSVIDALNGSTSTSSSSGTTNTAVIIGVAVVGLLVTPFIAGAVSRVVAASYLGEEMGAGPALRAALRRAWALFIAWVLLHLLEIPAFLACVLPGLLVMALFVATAPAIVIEELGPIRGMRRSARLTRPRLFPVMGIALLAGVLA